MPRRRRWKPVRGTGNRIYDPRERLLLGALDLPGRALSALARGLKPRTPAPPVEPDAIREVLVLRLDRMGDLLMSLPALADLRAALPQARIRLAVGRWSEAIARSAPVDEVLVWSAPWAGRRSEGADSLPALLAKARRLRSSHLDVALDLQGDVRALILMRLAGARHRVGYANTGGAYLLTQVLPLDETLSWVDQNRRAVAAVVGPAPAAAPVPYLAPSERDFARRLFESLHLKSKQPLVGIHPSGGRRVKQWDPARWREVAARLQREFGATILITGSEADRPLAALVTEGLPTRSYDLTGRLGMRETMAVIASLDLFLSSDTGPMHMACALGTPSVSVFGPSDPVRYFSGPPAGPHSPHTVVRPELWCSPCNLIRRPPAECDRGEPPECLRLVSVEAVHREASRLLRQVGGYAPQPSEVRAGGAAS